uniref:Uncharacterized protein n=1 Tax=Ditylenchus dipsaci TaxID=166011 RepID=A0A915DNU2_9BILA
MQNVPMKTEEGLQMVQHWMDQAIGVFMAAVANKRLKTQPKHVIDEFGVCSNKAQTIPMQAKCVSRLLKDQITGRKFLKKKKTVWPSSTRLRKYNSKKAIHMSERRSGKKSWIGGLHVKKYTDQNYRAKRNVVSTRKDYQLKSPNDGRMTPLGSVAHMLMKAVLASKNKTQTKPWQETVQRIRDSNTKRKLIKKRLEEESIENMEQFAFRGMKSRGMVGEDLNEIIEDPKRLKDFLTKKRSQKSKEPSTRLMNLLREGFKLGYTISGKNASKFDDKNLKIASPRFLSVVPENEDNKDNELDFLSPSLFSLHNQGKGLENLTSLPSLVKGFSSKDQQAWLDLIMEAAGVVEEAEKIEEKFSDKNERKIDLFEKLCQNFSKDQVKEMNKTGFAMLSPKQLEMLYGSESPYNNSKALKQFSQLNNSVIHQHIEDEVSRTAEMKSFKIRLKQIVLSPVSFTVIGPSSKSRDFKSCYIQSCYTCTICIGPIHIVAPIVCACNLIPRALGH